MTSSKCQVRVLAHHHLLQAGLCTSVILAGGGGRQVGQKRGRAEVEALDVGPDGAPRKKARAGFVAQQWITIYNKHNPMKQRCAPRAPRAVPYPTLVGMQPLSASIDEGSHLSKYQTV